MRGERRERKKEREVYGGRLGDRRVQGLLRSFWGHAL